MDIKTLRVDALRRVIGPLSQKEFADQHDLDASYLSQILNGHRSLGEKAALSLEQKIGLLPGVLVHPSSVGSEALAVEERLGALAHEAVLRQASPRAVAVIEKLARAAARGSWMRGIWFCWRGLRGCWRRRRGNTKCPIRRLKVSAIKSRLAKTWRGRLSVNRAEKSREIQAIEQRRRSK